MLNRVHEIPAFFAGIIMKAFASPNAALRRFTLFPRVSGAAVVGILIAIFLMAFLILPVAQVIYVAFLDARTGAFTFQNFQDFINTSLFRESFANSFYVSAMSVVMSTIIALPLAYLTTRFTLADTAPLHAVVSIP